MPENGIQNRIHSTSLRHPYPDEEVDHEEDVEGEVDLLGRVLCPGDALLYTLTTHRFRCVLGELCLGLRA